MRAERAASRKRAFDPAMLQCVLQLAKHRAESTVYMEDGGQVQRAPDIAHGPLIDESQRKQQPVGWRQVPNGGRQRGVQLGAAQLLVSVALRNIRNLVGLELGSDALDQIAALYVFDASRRVGAARPAITPPVMIERKAARDDEQPRLESRFSRHRVRAQPAALVLAQCLKDVRIRVHGAVVIVHDRSARAQDHVAVLADEDCPGLLALRAFARVIEASEGDRGRRRGHGRRGVVRQSFSAGGRPSITRPARPPPECSRSLCHVCAGQCYGSCHRVLAIDHAIGNRQRPSQAQKLHR